jgi:hypothetical protein
VPSQCFRYIPAVESWECGKPKGISTECGKGGKPASWLSILCHFHGLLWKRAFENRSYRQPHFRGSSHRSTPDIFSVLDLHPPPESTIATLTNRRSSRDGDVTGMSIAEVVDHLYVIEKKNDRVIIFFLTNQMGHLIPILLVFGFCFAVIRVAIHLGWDGNVISGLVSGSISMVAVPCFVMAEYLAAFIITIEPDMVSFQRNFQGIPVGTKKIYSRLLIRDLGVYLVENRSVPRSFKGGRLCLWADSRSIQLENFFPISEGASLAKDLCEMGTAFRNRGGVLRSGKSHARLRSV